MNDEEPPRPKGLPIGARAPSFDTIDIYDKSINLDKLLETNDAVLIDFFRGNW